MKGAMQRYDYVYVTSYNECDEALVLGLQKAFAAHGRSFAVLGYVSRYVENLYRALAVPFINLRRSGRLPKLNEERIATLQKSLGTTIAEFVFPESRYYKTAPSKLYRRLDAIMSGFEQIGQRYAIGCMIHKLGAELIRRCAMVYARANGVETVIMGTFPAHFAGRSYLHRQLSSERDRTGFPPANDHDEVSFEAFNALLDRIRDKKEVIHYPAPGSRRWSEAASLLLSMLRHGEYEFVEDMLGRRIELVRFRLRHALSYLGATERIPEGKFHFFPLHVFDDSQITVRNPQFFDQFWIIEYISRVLPHGVKLVVKLHPGLDGAVPASFVFRVKALKNVVLMRGKVNSHEVIKRAAGVIVINSTVAFEALLQNKPVLVLGHWAFGHLGMTQHADDLRALPQALARLEHARPDEAAVRRTLYDLYGEMYRCSYNREPVDYGALASAVMDYVGDRAVHAP
ncbi:MAG: hypothetical protein D6782_11185 [Alphaproteobacteria bacterium]|nr:MAG: hypothetical protein D6782_11185 [Alphaproteobacteria bacterium]